MKVNQNANRPVSLTTRDLALLKLLATHVLLSFSQIERLVFRGLTHPTILNRLKRLEMAGYVLRQRVHRISHPMFGKGIGVVFQVTPLGLKVLQKFYPDFEFQDRMPLLHGRQLDHDLMVVEVAQNLKEEFENYYYVSGQLLDGIKVGEQRPDGVFVNSQTQKRVALEIELTQKSSDRYREIVTSYRMDSKTNRVIFFVGALAIGRRLACEIKGYDVENLAQFKDTLFEIRMLRPQNQTQNKCLSLEGAKASA